MKNKSNILTSVMFALSAIFVPNNMRADEEAQKLLQALKDAAPAQRDPSLVYGEEAAAVAKAEEFLMQKKLLTTVTRGAYPIADEVSTLSFCEWDGDPDMISLIKYILTLDLGWGLDTNNLPPDLDICGVRALFYHGGALNDGFFEQLKNARALKDLELRGAFDEKHLNSLANVISESNLECIKLVNVISEYFSCPSMAPIANVLLTNPSLARLKPEGPFDILPLFTTHDKIKVESKEVERFPQLDVLDLRHYHIPAGTLEGLKSNPAQKFYLPQKLKMLWGKYDYPEQISIYPVELCKELVGRGLNLETLFIYCGDMNDERMKTLIEMIEQNHRNGGILSAVHFCSTMGFPPHADVSEKLKSDLLNALTESKIVLDGWIVKELDRPVGVSPEKSQ